MIFFKNLIFYNKKRGFMGKPLNKAYFAIPFNANE